MPEECASDGWRHFFLIWTTAASTFAPRYTRSIESIFRHHAHASVSVLSNTLPLDFFAPLAAVSLDIAIERYDLGELVAGTRASVWYDFRHHWNRSTHYANHEADLLRLLMLRRRGGVYVDADFILLRPLPRAPHTCPDGMLGIESGEGGARVHGGILAGAEVEGGGALPSGATLCNALMAFERGSAYLDAALEAFVSEYVPYPPELDFWGLLRAGVWGSMGPLLLTRVARRRGAAGPCTLERRALYPIAPDEILPAFGAWVDERDAPLLASLRSRSLGVHYWNQLSRDAPIVCGGLMHRLLEENCVVCTRLPCVARA